MISRTRLCITLAAVLAAFGGAVAPSDFSARTPGNSRGPATPPPFGAPLPGLSPALGAAFVTGLGAFREEDTVASGLGPIFNNVSCVACHSEPAAGGGSTILETRFGRLVNGQFDPLTALGGSLLQEKAIDPAAQEVIPPEANIVAQRMTTPLFGAGLIEAIPDAEILANAAIPRPDGIAGKASLIIDVTTGQQRVGRFGWKAQQATLLAFAADAYLNEIGITSRYFPQENAPNGNAALLAKYDTVPDPEDTVDPATGKADIDLFTDFMRLLAPPPALSLTPGAKLGGLVFGQIGCQHCHTPVMLTGPNAIPQLSLKPVPLYSDLLLHNMGTLGDGIAQAAASPQQMRTAPLWGLRARSLYLHDGRAASVDAAVLLHDGEALAARNRYAALGATLKSQLLQFLESI